jgi:hypothetical protein
MEEEIVNIETLYENKDFIIENLGDEFTYMQLIQFILTNEFEKFIGNVNNTETMSKIKYRCDETLNNYFNVPISININCENTVNFELDSEHIYSLNQSFSFTLYDRKRKINKIKRNSSYGWLCKNI